MKAYENSEIDFTGIATIEGFHNSIRQGIPVPDYYGDNLDALYDVLSSMRGRLIIKGSEAIDEDISDYIDKFRAVCADVRGKNPLLEILFA